MMQSVWSVANIPRQRQKFRSNSHLSCANTQPFRTQEDFMFAIFLALLMLLSACSSAPPTGPDAARALIEQSAAAMGGWAAMDAVKSQEIITAGGDWEPLQAVKPYSEPRASDRLKQ